ncbi:hypothetical protein M406DRAFT_94542 [Cryphonectria parasitica EP155]|uniref:Amidohydrolase-related domain-containing protein n=1 Tax=Cryphonectria parasitica (strain ATCC 38755 / EP155) TaxID=660469 RepID=A0A9P4Y015_CRYP1|nr:uncharacterized protein M406DRAFT_94542 [Cryphonectria parasitica EP155]KAF3763650.1 hypothetical protein M406DRAFT_94542 [Cryphonectria parasitica EP155]
MASQTTTPPTSSLLLKGGTLLLHDEHNHVVPTKSDLLIQNNLITKISPSISAPLQDPATRVLDCTAKIISPGFISTHAHLWQTQLKGLHPNHTLFQYLPCGCLAGSLYTTADLFWGQLSGAMESLDAGTTTVVDHAHLNLGPDYPRTAVQALATSGLRAVYCYAPSRRAVSFNPLQTREDVTDPAVLADWSALAAAAAAAAAARTQKEEANGDRSSSSSDRVSVGFAIDSLFLPTDKLKGIYAALRAGPHPAKIITSHAVGGPAFGKGRPYAVRILGEAGLLRPDVLLSHGTGLREEDVGVLREGGAFVSSTPNTEMQMGMEPVSMWRSMLEGRVGSLGVDCHSWGTSYMPTQMNLILQQRRVSRAQELGRLEEGLWPRRVEGTAEEAFNLGTIAGARAVGMEKEVGTLKEGYKADIVVFDGSSPGMLAAAAQDPVAAVVLHSSIRDVEVVIVDGIVRKEGGRLCDVRVEKPLEGLQEETVRAGRTISWREVAEETLKSRDAIREKTQKIDFGPAEETVMDSFHLNRATMVEN